MNVPKSSDFLNLNHLTLSKFYANIRLGIEKMPNVIEKMLNGNDMQIDGGDGKNEMGDVEKRRAVKMVKKELTPVFAEMDTMLKAVNVKINKQILQVMKSVCKNKKYEKYQKGAIINHIAEGIYEEANSYRYSIHPSTSDYEISTNCQDKMRTLTFLEKEAAINLKRRDFYQKAA